MLRVRLRTTGIVESNFKIGDQTFCLLDVGGQRNERRKWINCFDRISAVLFVVSMIAYDQQLYEDVKQNRMDEAIELFTDTLNLDVFRNIPFVMFFNKKDLFEDRIARTSISSYFEDYEGPDEFEESAAFMVKRFLEICNVGDRDVCAHLTCATDQGMVQKVFESVKKDIIAKTLQSLGYEAKV